VPGAADEATSRPHRWWLGHAETVSADDTRAGSRGAARCAAPVSGGPAVKSPGPPKSVGSDRASAPGSHDVDDGRNRQVGTRPVVSDGHVSPADPACECESPDKDESALASSWSSAGFEDGITHPLNIPSDWWPVEVRGRAAVAPSLGQAPPVACWSRARRSTLLSARSQRCSCEPVASVATTDTGARCRSRAVVLARLVSQSTNPVARGK
jgi:hypothetical protein